MEGLDSEFQCDVGCVVSITAHPGADRLELALLTFDKPGPTARPFPYPIVVGKGEFIAGDLCVYVSPDSSVSLGAGSPFAFLSTRLDAKGKDRYRIRSARLRGVFSPGLIVAAPAGAELGQSLAKVWDVKPYEAPQAALVAGPTGERGALPPPDRFPIYSVLSLKKLPGLFADGEEVVITEKIHGTNYRFGYGGGSRFFFGTHRTALSDTRGLLRRAFDFVRRRKVRINRSPGFGNPWTEAVEKFQLREVCRVYPQCVFYGELFGVTGTGTRVQDLTYGYKDLQLRIFDIWHGTEKRWLSYDERELVMASMVKFGLSPVAVIDCGPYDNAKMKVLAEKDSIYGGIREGVVIENANGPRKKAKWVSERYHMRKDA